MRAKDFIPANKPRNFVAKNAMKTTSGAGAHRDKKKEQKQGYEKHKGKDVAEGSEFGAYYSEQVAQEIFDKRQDITSEDEVLNQAYHIVSNDKGQKSARYMFNYDEDFPSDVVSAYFWLQKNSDDVAEGDVMEYETHRYKDDQGNEWEVNDEGERTLLRAAPGSGGGSRYGSRYPRRPAYNKPKGYYFYNVPAGKENDAKAAGLMQSKSGKWYSTMANSWAEKAFGKGRYWEPKN